MLVLVTGGTGFIGAHLCRSLSAAGNPPAILTRTTRPAGEPVASAPGARSFAADLLDRSALRRVVSEVRPDVVFHLAARVSARPDDPGGFMRVNGEGTFNLLEACAATRPAPRVVYASTMSVYPYEAPDYLPVDEQHPVRPADEYGLSKLVGELSCHYHASRAGLACAILRLAGVYGPGKAKGLIHNCLEAALDGRTVALPRGEVRRDFVYVGDVVDALLAAARLPASEEPAVFNIGSGVGSSLEEVVAAAEELAGRPLRRTEQDEARSSRFWFDIRRAEREIGFKPSALRAGMAASWQAMTARSNAQGGGART